MGHTITIRLDAELAQWLAERARKTGMSQGQIIRDQLEKARSLKGAQSFMRLAGSVRGPRELSKRKGYSRT